MSQRESSLRQPSKLRSKLARHKNLDSPGLHVSEPNCVDQSNVLLVDYMRSKKGIIKVAIVANKVAFVFWRMFNMRLLITAWSYSLLTAAGVCDSCPHSQHSLLHNTSGSDTSRMDFVVNKLVWWNERPGL